MLESRVASPAPIMSTVPSETSASDIRTRALVLDFDGFFIDTETTSMRSWQELYSEYGHELPVDRWLTVIGTWDAEFDAAAHLDELVGRRLDWEAIGPRRLARERELASGLPLLPGVEQLLDSAASLGLPLAVASSSSRAWVAGHLERLGLLERIDALACRDDVARTKPDPALFRLAAERLGVEPGRCVAFEDSLNGVRAAHAAGMPVVVVPSPLTRAFDFSDADAVLPTLEGLDLPVLLDGLHPRP